MQWWWTIQTTSTSQAQVHALWASDILTIKYNPEGTIEWLARYSGFSQSFNVPCALRIDRSGNLYVLANGDSVAWDGNAPLFTMVKYDPLGQQVWAATYGSRHGALVYGIDMEFDQSENVLVTGYQQAFSRAVCCT